MIVASGLRTWLSAFSGLAGNRINMDCLGDDLGAYSINTDPSLIVKNYLDGTRSVEQVFVLSSVEPWGEDIAQNSEALEWYENLSSWVREKVRKREFPELGKNRRCILVEIVSAPYLMDVGDNGSGLYQVQIKIKYFEE